VTDEQELLEIAQHAARRGAAELTVRFGHAREVKSKSTPTDWVSEADLASEDVIRRHLELNRPGDAILGEEGGATGDGALRWVVDPLDGTVNYLYEIPAFSVSIACQDASGTVVGAVLDPIRGECFTATRSGPALLDGAPLSAPSRAETLDVAMIATGFGYDAGFRGRQAAVVSRVLPRARDVRRFGSAALDLCWTAAGRFDGYYERGIKEWDFAAGALIAQRAGLEVRELVATELDPGGLVVGAAAWIDELYELVSA
jgi:myo-inositol-1(or 4)-monophosphatase